MSNGQAPRGEDVIDARIPARVGPEEAAAVARIATELAKMNVRHSNERGDLLRQAARERDIAREKDRANQADAAARAGKKKGKK